MNDRRIDVIFYGLFMDTDVLRDNGVAPERPRQALLDGFVLRVGQRATLVPCGGSRVYGMLLSTGRVSKNKRWSA